MSAGFLPIARRQPADPASFVEGGPAGASADRFRRPEGKRLSSLRGSPTRILRLALLLALQPVGAPLGRGRRPGDLDPTFGSGGKVTTDFGGGSDVAIGVALQPDGKIVAAGTTSTPGVGGFSDFALARYNSDGSLDATFGSGGKVTTDFGGGAEAVALQPDGKIVAAGSASPGATIFSDFALARYNPDGSLDATFGSGGKVTTEFTGNFDQANAVALQPNGKIVAAGTANTGTTLEFALVRYKKHGGLDPSFGSGGKVTTDFTGSNDVACGVALQPDRKIVAVGHAGTANSDFALARYLVE